MEASQVMLSKLSARSFDPDGEATQGRAIRKTKRPSCQPMCELEVKSQLKIKQRAALIYCSCNSWPNERTVTVRVLSPT